MNLFKKFKAWFQLRRIDRLYEKGDYLDAYQKHTDIRVDHDPRSAIGGDWDLLGELQYNFLKNEGLLPESNLLDIGMGTLRGGRFFIQYLEEGNYTGFDISPKAVEYASNVVKKSDLKDKNPTLLLNENKDLEFTFLHDTFDFILAQSVFTHLFEEHIEEAFANLHKIMHIKSRFYFTIFLNDSYKVKNHKDVYYPISFFTDIASKYNFLLSDCSEGYKHPKGQKMLMVKPIN